MIACNPLLIEIGTEELPPKALRELSEAFTEAIRTGLDKANLAHGDASSYATPRRLAVLVSELAAQQPDRETLKRGPAEDTAFDETGNPTRAAKGFAASCGVEVDALETLETDKGRWLAFRVRDKGAPTATLVPAIVTDALAQLPIPKPMRWGEGDVEFVRPVHWIVLLYGTDVIDTQILGVQSGRKTRGHRFHQREPLQLVDPGDYVPTLEERGKVLPDFDKRRAAICKQVKSCAAQCGGTVLIDPELLDEVTSLVEWPVCLAGSFSPEFLEMPPEVLIATLKDHQKCFPVMDEDSKLLPYFIAVSNIESANPDAVRHGNERVVNPRLKDAAFFWDQDRRKLLARRIDELREVVFQSKLGTLHDKSVRVRSLAGHIAGQIGANPEHAARAGLLSKCDLLTAMVGEFPELQGLMGKYYASNDGESPEVATALAEQYMPRFANDELPDTKAGQALAVADKVDTLIGIFGIGQPPTGDKDPFALRRAALGALRILIECRLDLDLQELLKRAAQNLEGVVAVETPAQVFEFMMDRLRRYYLDDGITPDVFEAVLERRPTRPYDFDRRIRAVAEFRRLPEANSLAAANKRIVNILKKAKLTSGTTVDERLLTEPAEKQLAAELASVTVTIASKLNGQDYAATLTALATLRDSVDAFFDSVMVMCDDRSVRNNRLALLNKMNCLFLEVADISRLQD